MYFAAFDIGGTKTIVAIVKENGEIITKKQFPSYVQSSKVHLDLCIDAFREELKEQELTSEQIGGIGVTLPGIVDNEHGILLYAPFANWKDVHVAEYLTEQLGVTNVCCENDVNACAIGELKFGLGKKYTDFVWMTVSTGVGGAVVSDSKLNRGAEGFAGELGHLKVEYDHPVQCPCGQWGCLEAHGSGTAMNRMMAETAEKNPEFAAKLEEKGLKKDGAGCAALAGEGNEEAQKIFDTIGMYLGRGIAYCINVLNPQAIVIGGGVSASLERIRPSIQETVEKQAFGRMNKVDVVCTPLGYEAALIGAAALVIK